MIEVTYKYKIEDELSEPLEKMTENVKRFADACKEAEKAIKGLKDMQDKAPVCPVTYTPHPYPLYPEAPTGHALWYPPYIVTCSTTGKM